MHLGNAVQTYHSHVEMQSIFNRLPLHSLGWACRLSSALLSCCCTSLIFFLRVAVMDSFLAHHSFATVSLMVIGPKKFTLRSMLREKNFLTHFLTDIPFIRESRRMSSRFWLGSCHLHIMLYVQRFCCKLFALGGGHTFVEPSEEALHFSSLSFSQAQSFTSPENVSCLVKVMPFKKCVHVVFNHAKSLL